MKTCFAVLTALIILSASTAHACGYMAWSQEAEARDAAIRNLLGAPVLPLLSPSWHNEYWLIAWARTRGKHFSNAEIDALAGGPWLRIDEQREWVLQQWLDARSAMNAGRVSIRPYRTGADYRSVRTCFPDMFRSATTSLEERRQSRSAVEVARWLAAQDRVFAACAGPSEEPTADAQSLAERYDRDYQRALWAELQGHAETETRYETIAASASPWAGRAAYRLARRRLADERMDTSELEAQMSGALDNAARNAFQSLHDRYVLFQRPPAEVVQVLAERLLHQDLGDSIPSVLRDIVIFAKRADANCEIEPLSLVNCEDEAGSPLTRLRHGHVHPRHLPEGDLLEINRRFHAATLALRPFNGRARNRVRQQTQHLDRLAANTTAATRNAIRALKLAARIDPLRNIAREDHQGGQPAFVLHGDGRAYLRAHPNQWAAAAHMHPWLATQVAQERLVHHLIRGEDSEAIHLARSSEVAAIVAAARVAPSDRDITLLSAVAEADLSELSVLPAFGSHYGAFQDGGCQLGQCADAHPNNTAVAQLMVGDPDLHRAGESRLIPLGRRVLALVRAHPDHERAPELLHHLVALTRRASLHRGHPQIGPLSQDAFVLLHERYPDSDAARSTPYWFR